MTTRTSFGGTNMGGGSGVGGGGMSSSHRMSSIPPQARTGMVHPPYAQQPTPLRTSKGPGLARDVALPTSVGEWLRTSATPAERDNLVAFMSHISSFQSARGLEEVVVGGNNVGTREGDDNLLVPLGPHLRVGIRVVIA